MRGRPKKPEGEVRENILRIRLTDAERAVLDSFAVGKSLDTSAWARDVLLAMAQGTKPPTKGKKPPGGA